VRQGGSVNSCLLCYSLLNCSLSRCCSWPAEACSDLDLQLEWCRSHARIFFNLLMSCFLWVTRWALKSTAGGVPVRTPADSARLVMQMCYVTTRWLTPVDCNRCIGQLYFLHDCIVGDFTIPLRNQDVTMWVQLKRRSPAEFHSVLLLICISLTITGQPWNSVFIRRV